MIQVVINFLLIQVLLFQPRDYKEVQIPDFYNRHIKCKSFVLRYCARIVSRKTAKAVGRVL